MEVNSIGGPLLYITVFFLLQDFAKSEEQKCQSGCICNWTTALVNCSELQLDKIPDFGFQTSSICQLYFRNNSLRKIEKNTFENFTSLTTLYLDFNNISEIEIGAFSNLPKLKDLTLNGNSLSTLKSRCIYNITTLSVLEIENNSIEIIEENAIGNLPNLTLLSLANNRLSSLNATSFSTMPLVKTLYLKGNRFMHVPVDFLSRTPNVHFILLDGNKISNIDDFAFTNCRNLSMLHLSDNQIRNIQQRGFMFKGDYMAPKNLQLKTLHLNTNKLDTVPLAVTNLSSLQHLYLDKNLFKTFPPFCLNSLSDLRTLHISKNGQLERIESKAFAGLYSLSIVYITQNPILSYIADDAFQDSSYIHSVFLEHNALRNLSLHLLNWDFVKILRIESNNFSCSCDLIWLQKSKILQQAFIKDIIVNVQCSFGNVSQNIMSLDPTAMGCDLEQSGDTIKSRVVTGLIAASVVSTSLIICFILVSCRRKFYSKYIHFKYRRQRDDPLFTVEDPRAKSKMFSSKSIIRNKTTREETLM